MSLNYGQIVFKASHNSYDRNEKISDQLTFYHEKPYNCGCMGLEFDIWRHTSQYISGSSINEGFFTVSHQTPGDKTLKSFLDSVYEWHKENLLHDPVLITLDIKSSDGGYDNFHQEIDTYLKVYFGNEKLDTSNIFRPADLATLEGSDLCQKVIRNGWPSLGAGSPMKGKFIFCLSGNKAWKAEYAKHELLTQRLCFSDLDQSDNDDGVVPPEDGNIVFFNFNIFHAHRGVWMNTIPAFAKKNLIVRTYEANSENNWNDCVKSNVSAIATNKIKGAFWAKVSDNSKYNEKYVSLDKRSLKNKSNNQYRTDRATHMTSSYEAPRCNFVFEPTEGSIALRNAKNDEYLDCTISTMSPTIKDNCQRWKVIKVDSTFNEYYIQNVENKEYLTKAASQLHKGSPGEDEVYILEDRP